MRDIVNHREGRGSTESTRPNSCEPSGLSQNMRVSIDCWGGKGTCEEKEGSETSRRRNDQEGRNRNRGRKVCKRIKKILLMKRSNRRRRKSIVTSLVAMLFFHVLALLRLVQIISH